MVPKHWIWIVVIEVTLATAFTIRTDRSTCAYRCELCCRRKPGFVLWISSSQVVPAFRFRPVHPRNSRWDDSRRLMQDEVHAGADRNSQLL